MPHEHPSTDSTVSPAGAARRLVKRSRPWLTASAICVPLLFVGTQVFVGAYEHHELLLRMGRATTTIREAVLLLMFVVCVLGPVALWFQLHGFFRRRAQRANVGRASAA
jgi:hypothetical protein